MSNLILDLKHLFLIKNAKKVIFFDGEQVFTGDDFHQKVLDVLAFFINKGLVSGDRVAVLLPNSMECIFCYFACMFGGLTIIPINPTLPAEDIDYILTATKPKLCIKNKIDICYKEGIKHDEAHVDEESLFALFFTSGTTSRPKGIGHSVKNMISNAISFNTLVGLDEKTVMLHVMPMGYMAGFLNTVLSPILAGGAVVLDPQFNASKAMTFWTSAQVRCVNALWITPTMAALLARLNRDENTSNWVQKHVRHVFVGTAPLPEATKLEFERVFRVSCLESYGMTEVMLVSSNQPMNSSHGASVGKLLPGVEIKAVNLNGEHLSYGEEGSLYIKTPFASLGYLNIKTGYTHFCDEEWFATGDVGYLDEKGYLFITGRIKDLIIHGGTNISPRAVEEVLLQYSGIQDAVVVGKPHPFWGEEVVAFLIIQDGCVYDEAAIKQYCLSRLQSDAVPEYYQVVKTFPRTNTGKIQNNKLKALL